MPCGRGEFAAQLLFQRDLVGLDKRIKPDARAPVGERDDGGVADVGVLPDQLDQNGASLTSRLPPPSRSVKLNRPRVMAW